MSDKVIGIFDKPKSKEINKENLIIEEYDFSKIMNNNKLKSQRMEEQKKNGNKSVLRSYRIKN